MHLALTDPDERELRNLIAAAHHRQRREALEAERSGKVAGGVWGFVSYSYRVSFTKPGGASEFLWLHTAEDAAWLDGRGRVDHVVFTTPESARLLSILARAVPRIMPVTILRGRVRRNGGEDVPGR